MRWVVLCCLLGCGRIGFDMTGDGGGTQDGISQDGVPPDGNVAFVTSSVHVPGTLGTLGAADAICMARASEAGLAGMFMAWLSTTAIDAQDRFPGARGWYRVDGQPLADTVGDLVANLIFNPIRLDERGRDLGEDFTYYAATGTYNGVKNTNCNDFTDTGDIVMSGYPQYAGGRWANSDSPSCAQPAHLYCFQIDHARPLTFTPQTGGRRAFLSSPAFTPSTGLAAADAVCMADAAAATPALTGTFKALLQAAQPAAARFDAFGAPWVRVDGIGLAPTADAFLRGASIAPLNVTASGTFADGNVLTGFATGNAYDPPDASRTCDAWMNASGTSEFGYGGATGARAFAFTTTDCSGPVSVYCLEE